MAKHGGEVYDSEGQCGVAGKGITRIAPAAERSEWAKSTDMATTMWATLRADGFKPPFSSRKDVSVFTAMDIDLNKKIAKAVANLAGLDIRTIAYEQSGGTAGVEYSFVALLSRMAIDHASLARRSKGERMECQSTSE